MDCVSFFTIMSQLSVDTQRMQISFEIWESAKYVFIEMWVKRTMHVVDLRPFSFDYLLCGLGSTLLWHRSSQCEV